MGRTRTRAARLAGSFPYEPRLAEPAAFQRCRRLRVTSCRAAGEPGAGASASDGSHGVDRAEARARTALSRSAQIASATYTVHGCGGVPPVYATTRFPSACAY